MISLKSCFFFFFLILLVSQYLPVIHPCTHRDPTLGNDFRLGTTDLYNLEQQFLNFFSDWLSLSLKPTPPVHRMVKIKYFAQLVLMLHCLFFPPSQMPWIVPLVSGGDVVHLATTENTYIYFGALNGSGLSVFSHRKRERERDEQEIV